MSRPHGLPRRLAAACLFLFAVPVAAHAQASYRTVALTGQAAPDSGAPWSSLGGPLINAGGSVAFTGRVGAGDEAPRGVWLSGVGGTRLVALEGRTAPGSDGAPFVAPNLALLSDGGHVGVSGYSGTQQAASRAFWVGRPGELRLLVREFDAPAPGTDAPFRNVPTDVAINAFGQVAFTGLLARGGDTGSNNDGGAWAGTPGDVRLVVRTGTAPFNVASTQYPKVNDAGRVAFMAYGFGSSSKWGIFAGTGPGDLQQVVDRDAPAPGLPNHNVGSVIGPFTQTNSGGLAFQTLSARLDNGVLDTNVVWRLMPGDQGPALLASTGAPAPGTAAGVTFKDVSYSPLMNESGRVLFSGRVEGAGTDELSDDGLWAGTPGDVRLVAMEGQSAPGTGGARFGQALVQGGDGLEYQGAFESVQQNDAGQVAWLGSLVGEAVTEANDTAIFATGSDGRALLVAREGDLFDTGGGDVRRIDRLFGFGSSITRPEGTWFNNAGELAFTATFTDGSAGVFVAVVPEPAAAIAVVGIVLVLGTRPHRAGSRWSIWDLKFWNLRFQTWT